MRPPRIHPMLTVIVQTGFLAVDGLHFTERAHCPQCGGALTGYDTKRKQFAHLFCDNQKKTVYVFVKRFYCRDCHKICSADEPFYPNTRTGSLVIDLVRALSMTMPVNRVAAYLEIMGIVADRTSCRNYMRNHHYPIETNLLFGVHLPRSLISLSALATQTGKGGSIEGAEVLAACGFPSAQRTALHLPPAGEERKDRNEQEHKEERQMTKPQDPG
ncbi:MAG: hypothetical protein PHF57_11090 [Methanoregula sp.]|nr:hypothetical protein [Methanoregula sp.]